MDFVSNKEPAASCADSMVPITVACLCAAWCDTCNQFRPSFDAIANARPQFRFVWVDIEDDAAACGDLDVQDFPTLLIVRGKSVLHFGVSLPHQASIARLIDEMATRETGANDVPDPVRRLSGLVQASADECGSD